ncbi:MAG: prepilin-type N-terminal cleavage/methylation domain-containing protein [Candidatus Omnitrophota bacterium]
MRKSVTLIELLVVLILFGVIITAAFSFDLASRRFLRSTETKTSVLNDVSLIVDYMHKEVSQAQGSRDNLGIDLDKTNPAYDELTITKSSGIECLFRYYKANKNLVFFPDKNQPANIILSGRVTEWSLSDFDSTSGFVNLNNITVIYDTAKGPDPRENPTATMTNITFFPFSHSF